MGTLIVRPRSLGIVLYEFLDGQLPVDLVKSNISKDAKDLIQGLLKTDPT